MLKVCLLSLDLCHPMKQEPHFVSYHDCCIVDTQGTFVDIEQNKTKQKSQYTPYLCFR